LTNTDEKKHILQKNEAEKRKEEEEHKKEDEQAKPAASDSNQAVCSVKHLGKSVLFLKYFFLD
jgi:hypothetical protein